MLNFKSGRFCYRSLIVAVSALTTSITATADDLDVFRATLDSQNVPNILLVLDYSGSMSKDIYGDDIEDSTTLSRLDILKSAVNSLLEDNKGKVNVGLGSTYNNRTSGVRWPISDLNANANTIDPEIPVADNIKVADVISSLLERKSADHTTSTVNALAEAAAYFRGDDVLHSDSDTTDFEKHKPDRWNAAAGRYESGDDLAAMPASYTPANAYNFSTDTWATPKYNSPLTKSCQANFIVLISDGVPTNRNDTQTLNTVLNAAGVDAISDCEDLSTSIFDNFEDDPTRTSDDHFPTTGDCAPEIVEYLATNNINEDIEGSNVNTFTVGFAIDDDGKDFLQLLARKGRGEFYEADKPEELTAALNAIIDTILSGSQNFAELAIDVNPEKFSHGDRAYFSLFSPSSKSAWQGNMKGYFVDETGLIDINGNTAIVDTPNGASFADTTQSFWSSAADGNEITQGGASESITDLPEGPNDRKIYTYLGGGTKTLPLALENQLSSTNTAIDNTVMGTATDAERVDALNWIANAPMGDPLHTKPVVLTYEDAGVTTNVAYVMTNQGLLHAFNTTLPIAPDATTPDVAGGEELFAFMPKELLSNLPKLHTPTFDGEHIYGLDGPITRWHEDINRDGYVNGTDTVQLIFAMRRGGYSYYSLDVTNPQQPTFNWQISKGDFGFEKLAQTWSRASLVSVKNGIDADGNPIKKRVLMFGGGYDADVVDNTTAPTEASGNAIYMADEDGQPILSIDDTDHPDMDFSIPSDLTIIDSDRNGVVDRAYFGDLGGQLWRVDFDDINNTADVVVTKLADVKELGEHQPIFYPPSISMNKENGERYTAVAFGTGDRTQPMLKDTDNALFMLRDPDYKVGPPEATRPTITRATIYDATLNEVGSSDVPTQEQAKEDLKNASGWAVYLNPGEKALSKVVTFDGKFMATTFEPNIALDADGNVDPCNFSMFGRLYVMSLKDAQPEGDNRIINLRSSTIPSSPVVTFPEDSSKAQIFVDKESVVSINKKISTVFWHAK